MHNHQKCNVPTDNRFPQGDPRTNHYYSGKKVTRL